MLATPHLVAGAAIGKLLKRPLLAWPAAFASHFLLDHVPHLDSHALFGVQHGRVTRPEAAMAIVDVLLGILLVLWAVGQQPERRVMLGGAFFALLIDLLQNVGPWSGWLAHWPPTAGLCAFHRSVQHNVTPADWPLGFGTQVATVTAALWVICRRDGRRGEGSVTGTFLLT
jgi:hypothetical protein